MIDLFFMLISLPLPAVKSGLRLITSSPSVYVYIQPGIFLDSPSVFQYDGGFYYCEKESIAQLSIASTSHPTACISIPLFIHLMVNSVTLFDTPN